MTIIRVNRGDGIVIGICTWYAISVIASATAAVAAAVVHARTIRGARLIVIRTVEIVTTWWILGILMSCGHFFVSLHYFFDIYLSQFTKLFVYATRERNSQNRTNFGANACARENHNLIFMVEMWELDIRLTTDRLVIKRLGAKTVYDVLLLTSESFLTQIDCRRLLARLSPLAFRLSPFACVVVPGAFEIFLPDVDTHTHIRIPYLAIMAHDLCVNKQCVLVSPSLFLLCSGSAALCILCQSPLTRSPFVPFAAASFRAFFGVQNVRPDNNKLQWECRRAQPNAKPKQQQKESFSFVFITIFSFRCRRCCCCLAPFAFAGIPTSQSTLYRSKCASKQYS